MRSDDRNGEVLFFATLRGLGLLAFEGFPFFGASLGGFRGRGRMARLAESGFVFICFMMAFNRCSCSLVMTRSGDIPPSPGGDGANRSNTPTPLGDAADAVERTTRRGGEGMEASCFFFKGDLTPSTARLGDALRTSPTLYERRTGRAALVRAERRRRRLDGRAWTGGRRRPRERLVGSC